MLLLDEPTRGIDVGAKVEVYELMNRLAAAGKAIVMVSSELPELLGMSDRILMLHEGGCGGLFERADATQERLLAAAMGRAARGRLSMRATLSRESSMLLALLVIWAFFAWREPVFLSQRNLSLLSIELAITAVLALGMFLVLLPGQIDLSAGSGVGLAGAVAAVLVHWHGVPAPLALAIAALGAVAIWAGMGALVAIERIPAFIITLGGLLVFRGLHWLTIDNQTVPIVEGGGSNLYSLLTTGYLPPAVGLALAGLVIVVAVATTLRARSRRLALGFPAPDGETTFLRLLVLAQLLLLLVVVANGFRGLPVALVILGAVALLVHVLTLPHAVRPLSLRDRRQRGGGHRLRRAGAQATVIGAYALMGFVVAITGFMQTAYSGASTTTVGSLMELDAVAACVIGGTSLRGGRGSVAGVLFGALIMASLINGMTLMAVSPEVKYIARGTVLGLAVWLDLRLGRER